MHHFWTSISIYTLCFIWKNAVAIFFDSPMVTLPSGGQIRGTVELDVTNLSSYNSYVGIPYARVTNRFQPAEPVPDIEGVFEATDQITQCSQNLFAFFHIPRSPILTGYVGQEDCLILNVYTPTNTTELLPVLIFVHGGGFQSGAGSKVQYGPDYYLRKNIVLVTINYRLDIHGFLCLGIKEAPGNVGMKDQVEAFRWVQKNIKAFGGDPDKVTIFGESAGGASIGFHLLSPMSRGLFNQAIMDSTSALNFWAFQPEPLKIARNQAKLYGVDTEDPQELYELFLSKTPEDLVNIRLPRNKGNIAPSEYMFVPCAEKEINGTEPFLTKLPYDYLSNGEFAKVPMLMGYNSQEGYLFAAFENSSTIRDIRDTNLLGALPRDLEFPTEEEARATADQLKQLYFGNQPISELTLYELSRFEGEVGFIFPVSDAATIMLQANDQPMYLYKFSYAGLLNALKIAYGFGLFPGATHTDELFYMFKPILTDALGAIEKLMVDRMTTLWSNFVKFGNPTPTESVLLPTPWVPANRKSPKLFVIDRVFSYAPLGGTPTLTFLNETYAKYRRRDYETFNSTNNA